MENLGQDVESDKIESLAEILDVDVESISRSRWDNLEFEIGSRSYLVCTAEEAKSRAWSYILDSAWGFRAEFIAWYSCDGISADDIDNIRGDRCDDCNEAILALIRAGRGLDNFVDDAIQADGLSHFLAHYDHEEVETGNFLIYRTN